MLFRSIPGLDGKRLVHPGLIDSQVPEKVSEIINAENGDWRLEGVEQWLTEEQCKAIRVVPNCVNGRKDVMV